MHLCDRFLIESLIVFRCIFTKVVNILLCVLGVGLGVSASLGVAKLLMFWF